METRRETSNREFAESNAVFALIPASDDLAHTETRENATTARLIAHAAAIVTRSTRSSVSGPIDDPFVCVALLSIQVLSQGREGRYHDGIVGGLFIWLSEGVDVFGGQALEYAQPGDTVTAPRTIDQATSAIARDCNAVLQTLTQLRPSAFAWYIALSALSIN